MKFERQQFCGVCGATQKTKFCTADKEGVGRVEWHDRKGTFVAEPIEECRIRLEDLSKRQSDQAAKSSGE